MNEKYSGSMTVEAAIVMPVFVMIVFTFIMLTKLVYVHALIQQGLVQVVKEVSSYSYILSEVFGAGDLHSALTDILEGNIQITDLDGKIESIDEALSGNVEQQTEVMEAIIGDPEGYLADLTQGGLSSLGLNVYRDLLGEGTGLIAKNMFPKYVRKSEAELNSLLELLGVAGGLDGVRMKGKVPEGDESPTLDIVVAYKINMDPPLDYFLKERVVIQRASCVPWSGKSE